VPSTLTSPLSLHVRENDVPDILAQTRVGEVEVERFRVRDGYVGVHVLEAEEERGADGDAGCVGGRGEAAEGEARQRRVKAEPWTRAARAA